MATLAFFLPMECRYNIVTETKPPQCLLTVSSWGSRHSADGDHVCCDETMASRPRMQCEWCYDTIGKSLVALPFLRLPSPQNAASLLNATTRHSTFPLEGGRKDSGGGGGGSCGGCHSIGISLRIMLMQTENCCPILYLWQAPAVEQCIDSKHVTSVIG